MKERRGYVPPQQAAELVSLGLLVLALVSRIEKWVVESASKNKETTEDRYVSGVSLHRGLDSSMCEVVKLGFTRRFQHVPNARALG